MNHSVEPSLLFERFKEWEEVQKCLEPSAFREFRVRALKKLELVGFPTSKDEEWRFSGLNWFDLRRFLLPTEPFSIPARFPEPFTRQRWIYHYDSSFSGLKELPQGVHVNSVRELLPHPPSWFEPYWTAPLPAASPFTLLNHAFARDGFVVYLEPGAVSDEPLEFLFYFPQAPKPLHLPLRNLVILKSGARATLLEVHRSEPGNTTFSHPLTQIWLEEGAELNYYYLQETPGSYLLGETQFSLERKVRLKAVAALLGGAYGRRDLKLYLNGEEGEGNLSGLLIAGGSEELDFHTRVEHRAPSCKSDQYFKSVLSARAHGIFDGSIYVHPGAQKTDALQTNKNILLSDQAYMTTNPHLEIYADDVRCTHGATVGQVSEEEEFYLRTRGIPEKEARELLTYAFVSDILEGIPLDPLRNFLEKTLFARLVETHA